MRKIFIGMIGIIIVQVALAQSVSVENFQHKKHYFWQINNNLPLDKKNAIVLLKTEDKDFNFSTAKGVPLEKEDNDEGILLKVPDKTKYILISNSDMSEYAWRVPVKYLKKNNYYTAELNISDLTKEFKNSKQWVVFNVLPENSILTIDSVMHRINNGKLSLYLPIGIHSLTVESPFYESLNDSISLTDSIKLEKNLFLEPLYSYLTVESEDPSMEIFVDESLQGKGSVTIGRIREGNHRVSLLKNNRWVKDTTINIARSEKKSLKFPEILKSGYGSGSSEKFEQHPALDIYRERTILKKSPEKIISELKTKTDTIITAPVHFIVEDSLSRIFIDREFVGFGEWTGFLPQGFHLITTEKEGVESIAEYIEILDSSPRELGLVVPESSRGVLNIHGDVAGISVFIDERIVGETPIILKDVKAAEPLTLKFEKAGYKPTIQTVTPKRNDITVVFVNMEKN